MWFQKLQVTLLILFIPLAGLYLYAESVDVPIRELFFPTYTVVHLEDIPVNVMIANTKELREKGLSGKKGLDPMEGMLFIFDRSDYHGFHMKDMRFPIDIIWIGENRKVVGITRRAQPSSYPGTIFEPPEPARYVLEVSGNFAEELGIEVGDTVTLPLEYR